MSRLRRSLAATYLGFDPRSLGLFRVLLGIVLLADLYRRYLGVDYWYTDDGIVPSSVLLGQSNLKYLFSLFLHVSTHAQAVLGMVACGLVYAAFTVGFKTRLFHVLSLIALVSLNNRIFVLENGGNLVLNLLCTWSLFLPLGRRYSVDAMVESLRSRHERTPEELEDRDAIAPDTRPVVSLAVLAVLLQFATIYLFNVLNKSGPGWRDGSAVHYALYQERLVTVFGVWLRESAPYSILQAMSWGTLVLEAAAVVFILSPLWSRQLRLAAVVFLPLLHVGFTLCLHLGIFSYAMICLFALLLAREHWEWWEARRRRRGRNWIAYFDADCGICFLFCRIFARLDPHGRVRFVSNRADPLPAGVTRQIVERAIVVEDAQTGTVTLGAAGIADLIGALAFGSPLRLLLVLPGPAQIAGWLYDLVARNRTSVSRWFGLAACGVPGEREPRPAAPPARFRLASSRWSRGAREAAVLLLMIVCFGDLGRNPSFPDWLAYEQPEPFKAIVQYPRLFQYWRMFSPDVPKVEQTIAIEAVTADGRVVDPYNEVASRFAKLPSAVEGISTRLGMNQFFAAYAERVAQPLWTIYHEPLRDWILRYHERTGNPADRIVRFRAYQVSARSPEPGRTAKGPRQRRVFLTQP